jgi:hypothetical protein
VIAPLVGPLRDMQTREALIGYVYDAYEAAGYLCRPACYFDRELPIAGQIANARNVAARDTDAPILVFNDADSLCKPEQIREMVRLAEEAPGLVFGFTVYSRLADAPINHWSEAFTAPVEWQMFNSLSSGCIAIRRDCFEQVGGYDETWQYGFEDYDFAQRCAKLWPIRRVEGELYHLWHPRPAVEPEDGPDAERYHSLYGDCRPSSDWSVSDG